MSEVPCSMEATGAGAASYAARQRLSPASGWWGAALLAATEAALFGTMIASYFYLSFRVPEWPPAGIEPPEVTLPLALTGVLLVTSVPMFLAARAVRGAGVRSAWLWILLAVVVQAGYLAAQVYLFADDLGKFTPQESAYGSIYFTLLGLHHAHVLVGILLNLWLIARLLAGLTNYRLVGVRVVALYWYFVNAMAVLVVLTQLYPSLA